MIDESICEECNTKPKNIKCANHNMRLCNECAFIKHRPCNLVNLDKPQAEGMCQVCMNQISNVLCFDHSLRICYSCAFQFHKLCQSIQEKDFQQIVAQNQAALTQQIVDPFKQRERESEQETALITEQINKQIKVMNQQLGRLAQLTDQYVAAQLKDLCVESYTDLYGTQSFRCVKNKIYLQIYTDKLTALKNKMNADLKATKDQIIEINKHLSEERHQKLLDETKAEADKQIKLFSEQNKAANLNYLLPSNSSLCQNRTILYSNKSKELWAFGFNNKGQLCTGDQLDQFEPVKITHQFLDKKILQISCGSDFTIILTEKDIFSFGDNYYGQLGDGGLVPLSAKPINITNQFSGERIVRVSCGERHTLAITNNNNLYSFGKGTDGQLGDGNKLSSSSPKNIKANLCREGSSDQENIISVSCGGSHSFVIAGRSLFGFGGNANGQLGDGTKVNKLLPACLNKSFGGGECQFLQAKCGMCHSLVLTNKGIYSFGYNGNGRLGDGTTDPSIVPLNITSRFGGETILQINCGSIHSTVLTESNLYTFGYNGDGELGDGTSVNKTVPTKITPSFKKEKIKQVECYFNSTFVQTEQGLYSFGKDNYGQLGDKQKENKLTPVKIDTFLP